MNSDFLSVPQRPPIVLTLADLDPRWESALTSELNRQMLDAGRFYRTAPQEDCVPPETGIFIVQSSPAESKTTCVRIANYCRMADCQSSDRHAIVLGEPCLEPLRLAFQVSGAVATVTSIFDLAKVAEIVMRRYLSQPYHHGDWETEFYQQIPWPPATIGE